MIIKKSDTEFVPRLIIEQDKYLTNMNEIIARLKKTWQKKFLV